MVDRDGGRLGVARKMGAHRTVDPSEEDAEEVVKGLTEGKGCDTVIEAVGVPATFELCQDLVAPGGTIANVGVHGTKVDLHLEKLWGHNISITTRLVDAQATPMLLKMVEAKKLDVSGLITHNYDFGDTVQAYDTFKAAADHGALKVLINM
ncbi:hypothetical protein MMC08_007743 [Hypocenomyce scalaris]|nr:hypothetical protein [Hypocenomyce scalaris]